tara:strand:+ start:1334 stop:1744 length:411 start_codon:yes stop_codon:yes gene_type:complete
MFKSNIILLLIIFLIQIGPINSYSVEPDEILKNEKQEQRARIISKNVRCMICQNQSIDESDAELAKDLRILIRNKVEEGLSNKEIYNYLTERYGDFILLKPALKINTIVLWFLPFVLLLIGAFFIYRHNKKSKTSH